MCLDKINLNGWGKFELSPAAFTVSEYYLPRSWGYIYTNDNILLRINHDGCGYAQVDPPGGIMLYKQERYEKTPPFMVWFCDEEQSSFSNFFKPNTRDIAAKPDGYQCRFLPEFAEYKLEYNGWRVITKLSIAANSASIIMKVKIKNKRDIRSLSIIPVWRAHNTKADLALWDIPELYQSCRFFNNHGTGVMVETRDPDACESNRKYTAMLTDLPVDEAELCYEKFIGKGYWENPEMLYNQCGLKNNREYKLENWSTDDAVVSKIPVAALKSCNMIVGGGESFEFSIALTHLRETKIANLPAEIDCSLQLLSESYWSNTVNKHQKFHADWRSKFQLNSPDPTLNRYINEWIPLQLYWISKLDRGWPTGMRGTRDAAQDYSGISYIVPEMGKSMLLKMLACQRMDGAFLRQFSNSGPEGKHDTRDYVDSGCWVFEAFVDYLNLTGDTSIFNEQVRWLDSTNSNSVENHILKLLDYFVSPVNRGEHGLVKIKGGDWNDSLNNAGLEGRGESVMVSCQVVYMLNLAQNIFPGKNNYKALADTLKANIRKHALNDAGFLNGIFTDKEQWLFSGMDPDGVERMNSPVNSFGIIAKIFEGEEITRVIKNYQKLKGPNGYRLFYPPLGAIPIEMAGRMGSGDLFAGNAENGTVYNHGSQGFLIRALSEAGYGNMALEVLRLALPYDQDLHPVASCKTEPYGVLNCWSECPGREGEGERAFLSGTISTVFRGLYNGILGFKPSGNGVRIQPALPEEWRNISYTAVFKSYELHIQMVQTADTQTRLEVNGIKVDDCFIPEAILVDEKINNIKLFLNK